MAMDTENLRDIEYIDEELDDIEIHLENEKEELKYKHNTDFVCNKNFLEICTEELNNLKTRILA